MLKTIFSLRVQKQLAAILLLLTCLVGELPMSVLAENTSENNSKGVEMHLIQEYETELVEQLIGEKTALRSEIARENDEAKKEQLEKKYVEICEKLKNLGVSNEILEDIPLSGEFGIATYADLPSLDTLKNRFTLDTYYQYGYLDGKQYKFYNIIVTDGGESNLSYRKLESIVLCGKVYNENQAKQLEVDAVKFIASAAIATATSQMSTWIGFTLSTLVAAIPNFKSEYLLNTNNVITASDVCVDEIVRYVYGYDEEHDKWILVFSGNRAIITYNTVMSYKKKPGMATDLVSEKTRTYINLNALKYDNQYFAQYLLKAIEYPYTHQGLDAIYDNIDVKLDKTSGDTYTFPLHGTKEPFAL